MSAFNQFLTERVNDRLKTALGDSGTGIPRPATNPSPEYESDESAEAAETPRSDSVADKNGQIETTEVELEGFRIVRSIVCSEVGANRVASR